jgi:hypothetical protein
MTGDLRERVVGVKSGKGIDGAILSDASLYSTIRQTIETVESITDALALVSGNLSALSCRAVSGNDNDATFVKDATLVGNINVAVSEFRGGANSLNEALKLLREFKLIIEIVSIN